ncbi:hypothetical protein ACN47E_005820 [Coniothyrium glycines]
MRLDIFTLTAGLAATASAFDCSGHYFSFFNRAGNAMSYQRIDPGLYPGTESPHLHSFDGANGLSSSTNFADTQASTCTTARVKNDKSIYWRPSLFFNNGTGFYRVPEKSTKIYYKSGDGDRWANVTGFPGDFNMIAGDPLRRSDGDNPAGVRWGCHEPDGASQAIFDNGFPKGFSSCKYGLASEVTFPSCWNGEALDPQNPNAHMAYPSAFGGIGIENCPTTHRAARFPTIFIEFWYDISSFTGHFGPNDTPWVLSNGDPTGYGFHADFLNGWEKGVLEKATAETGGCNCGCGCDQAGMEQCFGTENVNNDSDADWQNCGAAGTKSSEASPVLEKLPGCNPLQFGPARATPVTGVGCDIAAPTSTGVKTTAATSQPTGKKSTAVYSAVSPSAKTSGKAIASAYAPISIVIPNKATDDEYNAVSPSVTATPETSTVAPSDDYDALPVPTLVFSEGVYVLPSLTPTGSEVPAITGTPSGGNDKDCPAPVYVTVTPTIYVTANAVANTTSCGGQTFTRTITDIATVTVEANNGMQYGSH